MDPESKKPGEEYADWKAPKTESSTEADFSEKYLDSLRGQEETRMAGLAGKKEQIRSLYPGFWGFC